MYLVFRVSPYDGAIMFAYINYDKSNICELNVAFLLHGFVVETKFSMVPDFQLVVYDRSTCCFSAHSFSYESLYTHLHELHSLNFDYSIVNST